MGFDAYQLGTKWSLNKGCGAEVDLDAYFAALPPHSVTRFNAYSSLASNKFTNAVDFSALDDVFDAAARHDQLLVAVLASGEGVCENHVFKDYQWFVDGWKTSSSDVAMPYVQWLETAVRRWRSSPALAGWEMVGEPEPSMCSNAACNWQLRSCPPDAAQILRNFFDAAGQRIRELDPSTPIWEGIAGGGQCGARGDEYTFIGQSPMVDVLDFHDYGPPGVPLPGDLHNGVRRRIEQARQVGKPLVMSEIGQVAGSCRPLTERATDLALKVKAQRAAGTAGALFWAFVPDPRTGDCTMDIGPDDPLFGVLEAAPG